MVLEQWYDPRRAESWDAVGLVCGDPDDNVGHVLLAVDAVPATVAEAMRVGAELLVSHHPLLLTPVHGVPADDPKGALVHRMIHARIAHYVAHTNADAANPGVSDALGDLLGLGNLRPLEPHLFDPDDKLVVFVPLADLVRVVDALAAAGAGRIGNYERCAWSATGIGTFRPEPAATPFTGQVGAVSEVPEARVEMVVPRSARRRSAGLAGGAPVREEPAFDLLCSTAGTGGLYWHRPGGRAAVAHDVAWIPSISRRTPCHRRRGAYGHQAVPIDRSGRSPCAADQAGHSSRPRVPPERMHISPPTFDIIRPWKR
jgi:putative NIF3 family GTP cyclohydrolase 1 type 2